MPAIAFDTLKYFNTLKSAGVPSQQAEAQANAMAEALSVNLGNLVTKDDLNLSVVQLRAEMKEIEQKQSARIDQLKQELSAKIDVTISKLSGDFGISITKLSGEMVWMRWMGGVGTTLLTTLLLCSLLGG